MRVSVDIDGFGTNSMVCTLSAPECSYIVRRVDGDLVLEHFGAFHAAPAASAAPDSDSGDSNTETVQKGAMTGDGGRRGLSRGVPYLFMTREKDVCEMTLMLQDEGKVQVFLIYAIFPTALARCVAITNNSGEDVYVEKLGVAVDLPGELEIVHYARYVSESGGAL